MGLNGESRANMERSKITIADVAQAAGVSTQTVSRVINKKEEVSSNTRNHVQAVIERLGYRPNIIARGLSTKRTHTIGLVVPDITNPFFPEIARGAEDFAWEHDYSIFLYNTGEDLRRERAVLQILEDKQVDGVIICSARQPDEQLLPLLERHQAVVVVNRTVPIHIAGIVRIDNAAGTALAIKHLLDRQRKAIAFLAGPSSSLSGKERLQSYRKTLTAAGWPVEGKYIVNCGANFHDALDVSLNFLTGNPEVDGLICYNDVVAAAAIHACVQLGKRVPQHIAVVGNDETLPAIVVTPALTTVRVPMYQIGVHATRMLIRRMRGDDKNVEIVLKPELVVRGSAP